jgi:hypothetical protein
MTADELPHHLTLYSYAYALDGGTTYLHATDESGREHTVLVVQHSFPEGSPSFDAIPGRVYFDSELVPIRSDIEARVLDLLRNADVRIEPPPEIPGAIRLSPNALILGDDIREAMEGGSGGIRYLVDRAIRFVESDDYLRFPERVEQAADSTLYDLWVDWGETNQKRVLAKLSGVLGVGIAGAREFLAGNRPLKTQVNALDVPALVAKYHAEGLRLRVVPEFRWLIRVEIKG